WLVVAGRVALDLLDPLVVRVERDRAAIDDLVVALEDEARGLADLGDVGREHLEGVLAGYVPTGTREREVEARPFEDLPARVGEVDVEALDRGRLVMERLTMDDRLALSVDERALVHHRLREKEPHRLVRRERRPRQLDRHVDP